MKANIDILNALNPMAAGAAGYETEQGRIVLKSSARTTTAALRTQVEKALRYRKVRVLVIDGEAFNTILHDRPEVAVSVLRHMSTRLRELNEKVGVAG